MEDKKAQNIIYVLIFLIIVFLSSVRVFAGDETELFNQAESYFYGHNYQLANESYNNFIKKYPLSDLIPDAMYKRAVCLYYLGRFVQSLNLLLSVEKKFRTTRYINFIPFWKGVIYYKKGECILSLKSFESFIKSGYNPLLTPKALLYSSLCYIKSKEYERAKERLDVLIAKKGYANLSPYEITLFGYILLKNKNYNDEIDFQRKINISLLPDRYREYIDFYRAEALWFMGKKDDAVKIYKSLMDAKLDIASVSFRRLYGYWQEKNDLHKMEQLLISAESRFSNEPNVLVDVWIKMGIESFNKGDYKLAQYLLLKALNYSKSRNTKTPYVIPLYLSEIYLKNNDINDALNILSEYEDKIKDKKSDLYLLLHLGKLYYLSGQYQKAIVTYKKFLKNYPESKYREAVGYLVAYLYYIENKYEDSVNYCNIVLKYKSGNFYYPAMKIKEIALRKLARYAESLKVIESYIRVYPDDEYMLLDRIRVLFLMNRYNEVLGFAKDFLDTYKTSNNTYSIITVKYLYGLSLIALKKFNEAAKLLETISLKGVKNNALKDIYPYVLYYRGWAYYKLGSFNRSILNFSEIKKEPDTRIWINAQFMIGWCLYQKGSFKDAAEKFLLISRELKGDTSVRALYLAGKSFENASNQAKALSIFKKIITQYKKSDFWDDSVFEYAMILSNNNPEEAVKYYMILFRESPESSLVDEALYRRAELFYRSKKYEKAAEGFEFYRKNIKNGKMIDASLYWEGMSWYKLGNKKKAVTVWLELIDEFKKSNFRADALLKIANIYVSLGDYDRAISFFNRLQTDYPDFSREKNIKLLRDKTRYLAFGYSEEEAELTAEISQGGGAESDQGREAMLKLSRIYLSQTKDRKKIELAFQYLNKILEKGTVLQKSEAYYLLGVYFEIKKDYYTAGKNFFNAAVRNKSDKDFFTKSVYKAAFNMKKAGYRKEAYALIKVLENSYPDSVWTKKAKKLLEN